MNSSEHKIDCICDYGKNLPPETEKCPKCGTNLKPLSKIYFLSDSIDKLKTEKKKLKKKEAEIIKKIADYQSENQDLKASNEQLVLHHKKIKKKAKFFKYAFWTALFIVFISFGGILFGHFTNKTTAEEAKTLEYYEHFYNSLLNQNDNLTTIKILKDSVLRFKGELSIEGTADFWNLMIKNDLPLSKANFEQLNIILPPKEEVEITYKIRSGESLSTIAYSIYGDFRKWEIIYNANRDKIENPSLVVAGTDIRIPILKK